MMQAIKEFKGTNLKKIILVDIDGEMVSAWEEQL